MMETARRTTHRGLGAIALLAALLGLAMPAQADMAYAMVAAKDLVAKTITLDSQEVLHVTDSTVITGPQGQRLSLAELPTAEKMGPLWAYDGDESIRYEASSRGGKKVAKRIEVLDTMIE